MKLNLLCSIGIVYLLFLPDILESFDIRYDVSTVHLNFVSKENRNRIFQNC